MMRRLSLLWQLLRLVLRVLLQCLLAGVDTASRILRREAGHPGLVRYEFAPMTDTGVALLGAMITLTPGSTVIDIDLGRRQMLLHLLDDRGASQALATIRSDFEAPLAALFALENLP